MTETPLYEAVVATVTLLVREVLAWLWSRTRRNPS